MKRLLLIWPLFLLSFLAPGGERPVSFDFYGDRVEFSVDSSFSVPFNGLLSQADIRQFYEKINATPYQPVINALQEHRLKSKLDDWLYYQLIRRTAQQVSPKQENYPRYTLYKWFLLVRSGYNSIITVSADKILFYIQTNETVYNLPVRMKEGKQFVCLNYHDYGQIDFNLEKFREIILPVDGAERGFTYKVTHLPAFDLRTYEEKEISFQYYQDAYQFKVRVNPDIKTIFANYPVMDYDVSFNIPLSQPTYASLIPELKKTVKGLNQKNGIEFLMNFTRYAFLYEPDLKLYGGEKRFSPEQTLLSEKSDCDDRASLFFFLVKEIYDLPMLVLAYPTHVTIAVGFDKPVGHSPIDYAGRKYSICEPTPQKTDLKVGELPPQLAREKFEVVYAYVPKEK